MELKVWDIKVINNIDKSLYLLAGADMVVLVVYAIYLYRSWLCSGHDFEFGCDVGFIVCNSICSK